MLNFQPTALSDLNTVLRRLVSGWQSILGDNFLGAYLGGSFAHGGWDMDSDVDFNVLVERELDQENLAALKNLHTNIFNMASYWGKHMEGSFFPQAVLRDLSRVKEPIWYLDNGSLDFEKDSHDNTLVNRWVLREHGLVLYGPKPDLWIPPISRIMLKAEVYNTMQSWGKEILTDQYRIDNLWAQAFAVLSFCRMANTLSEGEIHSKAEGAAWAKKNLAARWHNLIMDALEARQNQYEKVYQTADQIKVDQTKAFIQHIMQDWAEKCEFE
jgi:hypothetical protein